MAIKPEEYKKRLEKLQALKEAHNGEWLTVGVVNEYREKANALYQTKGQDVGERRRLRIELQERYGLLEVEAINILNGRNIDDYIEKYHRIQHLIVLPGQRNNMWEVWIKNELENQDKKVMMDGRRNE